VHFLRLLIAFALAVALPLQGLAATTCMCKLHQVQQHGAASQSAAADAGAVSRARHPDLAAATVLAPSDDSLNAAKKHGACPKCAMTCCHASAPAPASASKFRATSPAGPVAWTPRLLASWAEPVPDKPPRA